MSVTDAGTVLRNSVVSSLDPKAGAKALDVKDGHGSAMLRNVTVIAGAGSGTGLRCQVKDGTVSIVNAIVRGKAADIDARTRCTAAFSNFRPAFSTGVAPGTGNQSAEPAVRRRRLPAGCRVADDRRRRARRVLELARSRRPAAQPRRRAGHRRLRVLPPAVGGNDLDDQLPDGPQGRPGPAAGPQRRRRTPSRARCASSRPGAKRFTRLDEPGRIPLGSLIDARNGPRATCHRDRSWASPGRHVLGLEVRESQRRKRRRHDDVDAARRAAGPAAHPAAHASTAPSRARKRKRKRGLWARDNGGRFRTHGNDSVATARGTAWLTQDRCTGTYTRVIDGAVSVRDLTRHKRVLVKAGHSYLARAHR